MLYSANFCSMTLMPITISFTLHVGCEPSLIIFAAYIESVLMHSLGIRIFLAISIPLDIAFNSRKRIDLTLEALKNSYMTSPATSISGSCAHQSERNVFQCFVFGPTKAGNSALLNSFLGRPFAENYAPTTTQCSAANVVEQFGLY
ncbi:hypothetical protein FRX31_018194 [Thalictrum thalictroides]|uniref:Uncharacterized protein n=1 Tax=Thalictrum thalictroides TaxID=46969 RepID=A0A7J6W4B5_THATH|nr:hypothetical protein FRX31_018194 [Thalictrum thalictroides]